MTHPSERSNTALLVIDVQNDVVAKAYRRDAVIASIRALVEKARADGAPVIWVQHSDDNLATNSDGWRYVPELQRTESELLIHKHYGDSFEGTTLEDDLERLGVGRLIVTGAQPTPAFARRFTARSHAVTTHSWSAMRTPPTTCHRTACRAQTR